ncbi:MAG: bifunctional phosphoribosyl-AMP cyclohydrolase/phosphoribosyl-ATP diphosphatase HisIE [Bacteroidetes bacterium]|nr:bifunctional phosphoribosyl-AMP cyclohydrolase/phosphoribosyl-ATP diphosphatase HisIE [Bacteroidota bacterium]
MNLDGIRFDTNGLVPAVVQDVQSGTVLMLAYMNRESLQRTLETGETHFWSRSRRELWHKGATSGHTQRVVSIAKDCDTDALLVKVEQNGVACHTGAYSCFFTPVHELADYPATTSLGEVLGAVSRVIRKRNLERPEGSYTTKLLTDGIDRVLKKVGEEAGEVIIAAKNHAPAEITWEVADLLYHVLVMMEIEGIGLEDVAAVLDRRRGEAPAKSIGK